MEYHDAANIFPLDEEHLDELSEDIKSRGQQIAIEAMNGKIIDGRRRYLACQRAGVSPKVREVSPEDPVSYVISLNLHRRHLDAGQRALAAARAESLRERMAEEAKQRQKEHAGTAPGKKAKSLEESFPQVIPDADDRTPQTRDKVGELFGVSGKSVDCAAKVVKNAIPEVVKAVEEGRMGIVRAAAISAEPEETQRQEAAKPRKRRGPKPNQPSLAAPEPGPDPDTDPAARQVRGRGVEYAHEALNWLTKIPKDDPLRGRGFQIVTDWIKTNR